MKKLLAMLLAFVMIFGLAACGNTDEPAGDDGGDATVQPVDLTISIQGSEILPMVERWKTWADMVNEKSGDLMNLTWYYDGTLLDSSSAYQQLVAGVADIGDVHTYESDGFTIHQQWKGFTAGIPVEAMADMGRALVEEFPALQEELADVKPLAYAFDGGNYQLLTVNKPVESVADMEGLVIWCEADFNAFMEELGATPVNTPWPEVYSSLQKNMYDGMLIAAETLQSVNFAEVCNYVTMIDVCYAARAGHMMNLDTYNSLPDALKAAIDDPEVTEWIENKNMTDAIETETAGIEWAIENHGTTIIELDDAKKQEFTDAMNRAKQGIAEDLDAKGLPGTEMLNFMIEYSANY